MYVDLLLPERPEVADHHRQVIDVVVGQSEHMDGGQVEHLHGHMSQTAPVEVQFHMTL